MKKITHTRTDFCGLVGSMRCVIRSCLSHKWFVMCAISIYYYHKQHTIIQRRHCVARERASKYLTRATKAHSHTQIPWKGQQKGRKQRRQQQRQGNYGMPLKVRLKYFGHCHCFSCCRSHCRYTITRSTYLYGNVELIMIDSEKMMSQLRRNQPTSDCKQ